MSSFPILSSGAVTQYPTRRAVEHTVTILQYAGGGEQRFTSRAGVRRWRVELSNARDTDIAALEQFFEARQGRFGSFSFTDPYDGTVFPDCSLEEDTLTSTGIYEGRSSAVLIVRTNGS